MLIYNITNSETTTAKPLKVKYEFFSVYCKNTLNIPKEIKKTTELPKTHIKNNYEK
tara:strand:+ start:135 stop:302 length:168 start_codon:yes stop_codon:yes gene_type:complete